MNDRGEKIARSLKERVRHARQLYREKEMQLCSQYALAIIEEQEREIDELRESMGRTLSELKQMASDLARVEEALK